MVVLGSVVQSVSCSEDLTTCTTLASYERLGYHVGYTAEYARSPYQLHTWEEYAATPANPTTIEVAA